MVRSIRPTHERNGRATRRQSVRAEADFALGSLGKDAQTALAALKQRAKDADPTVQKAVAEAVKSIDQK